MMRQVCVLIYYFPGCWRLPVWVEWFPLSSYFSVIVRVRRFAEADRQHVKCSIAHFTHRHISSLSNLGGVLRCCSSQHLNQVEINERKIQLSYSAPARAAGHTHLRFNEWVNTTGDGAPDSDHPSSYCNKISTYCEYVLCRLLQSQNRSTVKKLHERQQNGHLLSLHTVQAVYKRCPVSSNAFLIWSMLPVIIYLYPE